MRWLFLIPLFGSLHLYAQQNGDTIKILSGGSLKEVKVRTPYEKWQKDSADNRVINRKRLQEADFKPPIRLENGLVIEGPFTWLALKISGKQKRAKKFKAEMEAHEREMLFDIRYNATLVKRLTRLQTDSAAYAFIRENPMSRAFFNEASELELMQWIRDKYRAWKK